jgi:hypothetical protein
VFDNKNVIENLWMYGAFFQCWRKAVRGQEFWELALFVPADDRCLLYWQIVYITSMFNIILFVMPSVSLYSWLNRINHILLNNNWMRFKRIWMFRWHRKVNALLINHSKTANVIVRVLVHRIYLGDFYGQNIIPLQGTGLKAI